jgi:hypothetical protein
MEHPDLLLKLVQFHHKDQLREVETWRLARIARQERARYGGHLLHRLVSAARLLFILASVTGQDFAPNLLAQGRAKAKAAGLTIQFDENDAENLPYDDA